MDNNKKEFKPYIPADKVVPEFTVTALLIGILLAIVFGAANAYLKIQLVMHDNEFRVVEQISDGLNDYMIPKLILQPLAENAIDHGIDVSDNEDPTLWLTIREENEHIFFEIRDNGAGMTQEKADQILTYQSSGYGVRNVCDRIHVLYGEKGEMKIESTPGKGTRVFIRIPKKTEAKVL